jgi:hypothetical protein
MKTEQNKVQYSKIEAKILYKWIKKLCSKFGIIKCIIYYLVKCNYIAYPPISSYNNFFFHITIKWIKLISCSTIIPEFCDFLARDVAEHIVCRYQHNQNHCPLEAGFVNQNSNQTMHV